MREVRTLNRAGRYNQIMIAFAIQMKAGNGKYMTAYTIARKIGLRPTSPNFRAILKEMVSHGSLSIDYSTEAKNSIKGKPVALYFPSVEIVPEKRHVAIRANGRQVGQLELF